MKLVNKCQMIELLNLFPYGGIVFAKYNPDDDGAELMVSNGEVGATLVVLKDGKVFDFDWDIHQYGDSDQFIVFDNNDVLQMMQTLISGLEIDLKDWHDGKEG